jgi:shikimate dehydrogenase
VPADGVRRCAVVGKPIAHSLSPLLHRAAYAALGLDWTYDRFEVSAADLADFVARLDSSWRGLSLTMPLKEAVLGLGEVDPVARRAGAGNTLILDGRPRVYNTDVAGLAWAVRRVMSGPVRRVSILGSGATARSAVVALSQLATETVTVLARTPAKAEALAGLGTELGLLMRVQPWGSVPPPADLVVAAATAGAVDPMADQIAAGAAVVLDIVYAPWPTPLAEAAAQAGRTVISGLDLLVGQALRQIELMTGQSVPAEVLYAALAENRSQTTGFGA